MKTTAWLPCLLAVALAVAVPATPLAQACPSPSITKAGAYAD